MPAKKHLGQAKGDTLTLFLRSLLSDKELIIFTAFDNFNKVSTLVSFVKQTDLELGIYARMVPHAPIPS